MDRSAWREWELEWVGERSWARRPMTGFEVSAHHAIEGRQREALVWPKLQRNLGGGNGALKLGMRRGNAREETNEEEEGSS